MSQYNLYSGLRAIPVSYESANVRGIPVPTQEIPTRSHYALEPQLGVSRTHTSYDQDPRAVPFKDPDHGRPGPITGDGSGSGNIRGLQDSQRGELLQVRQPRMMPVDGCMRYVQPDVLEPAGQTWNHLTFDPDLVDLSNGHGGHMAPEQPTFAGSPRSSSGRAARPLAPASENNTDDNLSTATTAVDSGRPSDSEMHQETSRLTSSVANIEQTIADIQKNQVVILTLLKDMVKKVETTDIATTTRLADLRDSVEKKFGAMDGSFDDFWDKISAIYSDTKRMREVVSGNSGHDPRRTPPTDDGNHNIGAKRRRIDE